MADKLIYFVRHGQTKANVDGYEPDESEPLNDTGFHQANVVATRTQSLDIERLFASNFLRAQQTAQPIAAATKLNVEVSELFGELKAPTHMIGMPTASEEVQNFIAERNANASNRDWDGQGGVTVPDMFDRVAAAQDLLSGISETTALVVSHGGFIKLFMLQVLMQFTEPTEEWFKTFTRAKSANTGITCYRVRDGKWQLLMFNDHAHFAE